MNTDNSLWNKLEDLNQKNIRDWNWRDHIDLTDEIDEP